VVRTYERVMVPPALCGQIEHVGASRNKKDLLQKRMEDTPQSLTASCAVFGVRNEDARLRGTIRSRAFYIRSLLSVLFFSWVFGMSCFVCLKGGTTDA